MKRNVLLVLIIGVLSLVSCQKETMTECIAYKNYRIYNQSMHDVVLTYNGYEVHLPNYTTVTIPKQEWVIEEYESYWGEVRNTYIISHEVSLVFDSKYTVTHTIDCPSDTMPTSDLMNKIGVTYHPDAHNLFNPASYTRGNIYLGPSLDNLSNQDTILTQEDYYYTITELDYEAAVRAAQEE